MKLARQAVNLVAELVLYSALIVATGLLARLVWGAFMLGWNIP